MSWTSDVRDEIRRLRYTTKELRKFAYFVGSVLILIGAAGIFKHWRYGSIAVLIIAGLLLGLCGLLFPNALKKVYMVWMGLAFALGWIVSRAILVLLFYLVITPVSIAARLAGKKFIDIEFPKKGATYWVPKGHSKKVRYDRMF